MTTSGFFASIQHSSPLTSVFPHLPTLTLCTSVSFNSEPSLRREQLLSLKRESCSQLWSPDFWRSLAEVTTPEGALGGPGTAELLPEPRGSLAGEGEHSHPHPSRGLVALGILLQLFSANPAPARGLLVARFASPERSVPCPSAEPEQPEHSRGGHGHNAPGAAAGGFSACFYWLPVYSQKFLCGAVIFPGLDVFKPAVFGELNCFLCSLSLICSDHELE